MSHLCICHSDSIFLPSALCTLFPGCSKSHRDPNPLLLCGQRPIAALPKRLEHSVRSLSVELVDVARSGWEIWNSGVGCGVVERRQGVISTEEKRVLGACDGVMIAI